MSIENQLKQLIVEKYGSVRAFTKAIDVPYSTIDSMLKRGIDGTGVATVLLVCLALQIDIEELLEGRITPKHAVSAETQKSPDTAEAAPGEDTLRLLEDLNNYLVNMGYIGEDDDLTDQQLDVLLGICTILRATFEQKE